MLLTSVALVSLLSADILSARIVYEFKGDDKTLFEEPALKTDTPEGTTQFTIHAIVEHTSQAGTVVSVWIYPGMSDASPVPKKCTGRPECHRDKPDKAVVRRLFTEALNDALLENKQGLGHYRVLRCGEKETNTKSWLELVRRVDLSMDIRHHYMLANCCKDGRPSSLTQLGLGITRWDKELSKALFGPMDQKKKTPGLDRVRWLCDKEPSTLERTWFITQLPVLSEDVVAPPVKKDGID